MTSVHVAVVGADHVSLSFLKGSEESSKALGAVVRHNGQLLRTRVMAKASGRPGPNVQTGDYRRSIGLQYWTNGGDFVATVGTNAPQGRRLEFGFHGADSLGRVYNQPPLPHFGPAFDETTPGFNADIAKMLESL